VVYRATRGEFRRPEWSAACAPWKKVVAAASPRQVVQKSYAVGSDVGPPLFVTTSGTTAEMERIARRSYLVRYVVELWGAGDSLAECAASVEVPSGFRGPWRLCVARIGGGKKSRDNCSLRSCQDPAIFEAFEEALRRLRKEEPVDLSESGAAILVAMDYPQGRVYCGRVVATGAFRDLGRYDLSKRPVLGATTMDVEIAGLMARLARLERGDVVLDPFAGSCGILLATTHLTRATSYASDLDAHLLPRAAELNFFALGDLPAPTVFAPCDVRDLDDELPPHLAFDAIVTDPPYGRRASSSRARGGRGGKKAWLGALLDLAAKRLKPNGRLVFFVPHGLSHERADVLRDLRRTRDDFASTFLLEAAPMQPLPNSNWFRTLVVLQRRPRGSGSSGGEGKSV